MRNIETENTTAVKYNIGQFVRPNGYSKSARRGKIIAVVPPIGTAGEWSYDIQWDIAGDGCGWRDCDVLPIL